MGWKEAFYNKNLRLLGGLCILLMVGLSCFYHPFFAHIEHRKGIVLNDWLLQRLPAFDASLYIFGFLWTSVALIINECRKSPTTLITFLLAYLMLSLCRVITISIVALDPPRGLIPLEDPLSNLFYGHNYITKDLFFSGHTFTVFLIALCLPIGWQRTFAYFASFVVGLMLLVNHVHYSIDVLCAPVFAYLCYYWSRLLVVRAETIRTPR